MITSREIRLKSRLVGMPSADNFELVTVSVPRPAPGEVQVQNLWMTVDPYMRGRMADRAIYTPSSRPGREVPGGAIEKIAASNSTMYGWRPSFQVGETHLPQACRSSIRSGSRLRHSWELPACRG